MNPIRSICSRVLAAAVWLAFAPVAQAQTWPAKPRLLAVSGTRRLSALPDVPTFAEAGLKHFGLINFTGLWAPKSTPQAVIDRL